MSGQSATPSDMPATRRALWRGALTWMVRLVVALVVIVVVGWCIFSYVATRTLEAEINRLRAAGQPLTFDEWERAQRNVAEADDAAPFYKAALGLVQTTTDRQVEDLMRRLGSTSTQPATAPAPSAAEVKEVLAANALALEMVDRGSSRPQCAYDLRVSLGIDASRSALSSSKRLARVLWVRTVWLARRGQRQKAVDSLVSSFRMLRVFDRQPTLAAYLVRAACTDLHVDALRAVLEAGPLSDQHLATLEQALGHADPTKGLERVYAMERLYTLAVSRRLIGLPERLLPPDKTPFAETVPPSIVIRPMARVVVADMLRMNARFVEAARKDWPQALDACREAARRRGGVVGFFSEILVPSFEKAFALFGRTIGGVRSAQVAVIVARYRLAKRHLPESLGELRDFIGHDLPTDPFTGKDLIYKVQGKGFSVYSVGEDKADDGGPERAPKKDFGVAVHRAR